jgi:hypothetical protein
MLVGDQFKLGKPFFLPFLGDNLQNLGKTGLNATSGGCPQSADLFLFLFLRTGHRPLAGMVCVRERIAMLGLLAYKQGHMGGKELGFVEALKAVGDKILRKRTGFLYFVLHGKQVSRKPVNSVVNRIPGAMQVSGNGALILSFASRPADLLIVKYFSGPVIQDKGTIRERSSAMGAAVALNPTYDFGVVKPVFFEVKGRIRLWIMG